MPFDFDITEGFPTSKEVHDVIPVSERVRECSEVVSCFPPGERGGFAHYFWLEGWFDAVRSNLRLFVVVGFDDPECGPSYEEAEPSEVEAEECIAHIRVLLLGL